MTHFQQSQDQQKTCSYGKLDIGRLRLYPNLFHLSPGDASYQFWIGRHLMSRHFVDALCHAFQFGGAKKGGLIHGDFQYVHRASANHSSFGRSQFSIQITFRRSRNQYDATCRHFAHHSGIL